MVDSHLIPDGTSPNQSFTETVRTTQGNRFTVASSTMLNAIRWHRFNTGTVKPNTLLVWLVSTGQQIVSVTPNDLGTVGWQLNAITPVQLFPGVTYCVGADNPVGQTRGQWVPHATPDSGITWQGSFWLNNTGGSNAQPTNNNGDVEFPYDVVCSPPTAVPTDTTITTDVNNAHAAWFSSGGDNTHHADLPWATKDELDQVQSEVGTPTDASTASTLFGRVAAVQGEVGTPTDASTALTLFGKLAGLASTPPTGLAGAVTTLATDITTAVSSIVGTAGRTISDVSHDVASVENHLLDVVSGRAGFPTGTPNTSWALAATTDFDTDLAWAQEADLFVVSITSYPARLGGRSFAGLTQVYRLGGWCVLNGTIGSQKRQLDFTSQILEDGGRRMAGLALRCQPGTIGTVQAWTLG